MPDKCVFAFTPLGAGYPEYLSINENANGDIEITVRGPKKPPDGGRDYDLPGDAAMMVLPRAEVAALVQGLLALSPLEELQAAKPLVLYFRTDQDRDEFVAVAQEVMPTARTVKV